MDSPSILGTLHLLEAALEALAVGSLKKAGKQIKQVNKIQSIPSL